MDFASYIRDIPDFPKKGVMFKDITPLLREPVALRQVVEALAAPFRGKGISCVVAIEARGYILGAPVAYALGTGFVPVRKVGKLPHHTYRVEYALEYGSGTVEMHRDGLAHGDKVLIIDDVLATGGTLEATTRLVKQAGGEIAGVGMLIELSALQGRKRNPGQEIVALLHY